MAPLFYNDFAIFLTYTLVMEEKTTYHFWNRKSWVMDRYFNPPTGVEKTAEYQFGAKWDDQINEGDRVVLFNEGNPGQIVIGTVGSTEKINRMAILDKTMPLGKLGALVRHVGAKDSEELLGFIAKAGNKGFNMEDTLIAFDGIEKYRNRDELPADSKDDIETGIAETIEQAQKQRQFKRRY